MDGWTWNTLEFQWELGYSNLEKFIKNEGHARIPQKYKSSDGFKLGQWCEIQKRGKKEKSLSQERIKRLDSLGFVWDLPKAYWYN